MNKYILLIVLLFLVSGRIAAQSVTVDAKIDSLQILIGEQAKVQLQVAMDAKQRAVFPSFTDTTELCNNGNKTYLLAYREVCCGEYNFFVG